MLWRNGVISNLNNLIPANSPLYLLTADAIDDLGESAGFGITSTGDVHAFLATPNHGLFVSEDSSTGAQAAKRPVIVPEMSAGCFNRAWPSAGSELDWLRNRAHCY